MMKAYDPNNLMQNGRNTEVDRQSQQTHEAPVSVYTDTQSNNDFIYFDPETKKKSNNPAGFLFCAARNTDEDMGGFKKKGGKKHKKLPKKFV